MAIKNVDACSIEIGQLLAKAFTPDESQRFAGIVDELSKKYEKLGGPEELQVSVMKAVKEIVDDTHAQAVIEKRNAVLNARAILKNSDYVKANWYDSPREAVKAILGGSLADRKGARNSVATSINALSGKYVGDLLSNLTKHKVLDIVVSGKMDADIFRALHEITQKNPDKGVLAKLPKEAVTIAEIINERKQVARLEANAAGAWIKNMPGHAVRRSHDAFKISKAAGSEFPVNDPRHEKAWSDWVEENLDWEMSMPEVPQERRRQVLMELFEQFSNGIHMSFGDSQLGGFKGAQNIGKKMSHSRVLHFKSPDAEFQYHKKFGTGDTLIDGVVSGLNSIARDTAIMQKLGPNAKTTIDEVVNRQMKDYVKQGKGHLAKEMQAEYDKQMKNLWPVLNGEANRPANETFARWSAMIRTVEMVGDLARAALSSTTDPVFRASTLRFTGERTNATFFKGIVDSLDDVFVGGLGDLKSSEVQQNAAGMGILLDAIQGISQGEMMNDIPGGLAKRANQFFKFNLLSPIQDRIRFGAAMETGFRHAANSEKAFSELPEGMRAFLGQFGVDEHGWNMIRATEKKTDHRGRSFLTPEGIKSASPEAFDNLPEVKQRLGEIHAKERKLIEQQDLDDAADAVLIGKRIEKFTASKEKAVRQLEEFTESLARRTDGIGAQLRERVELTKARIEKATVEADIASYLKNEKNRLDVSRFLDRVLDGEAPDISRASDRFGNQRGGIGEKLGERRARADFEIKKLEKKISEGEKLHAEKLSQKEQAHLAKLRTLEAEFVDHAKKINERVEARAERVKQYSENVGKFENAAREKARSDLEGKYRSLFYEVAHMAASEPGKVERAMMLQGQRPGTVLGESLRHFWMYKSFTTSIMRKHIGRELHGYNAERLPAHKAIARMLQGDGGGGLAGMANLMVFGTMAGYAGMVLKDLAAGKEPRVPTDAESAMRITAAAFVQGGSMGIYGDFLFGEMTSRMGQGPLETLLGPTWRRAEQAYDIFQSAKQGKDVGAKSFNFVLNNTPYVNGAYNLFYTKQVLDYLFVHRLQEAMNPGYLRRMEGRLKKEKNQEFLVPPSSVIPHGG